MVSDSQVSVQSSKPIHVDIQTMTVVDTEETEDEIMTQFQCSHFKRK